MLLLLSRFSRVRLCATPWTAAHQAPPPMGFSRQEYWSGVPLPSPLGQTVKRLPTMQETWIRSLGQEDLVEKETATHSSILAWKIPWTEERSRLQSIGPKSGTRLGAFFFFPSQELR